MDKIKTVKNIAIIVRALNNGGAERVAGLVSKELSKQHNVYLFLLDTENIVYEYGGEIVDIGGSDPFYEYDIRVNKRKYHIDCAISFLEKMNFANIRTRGEERVIISERSVQSLVEPAYTAENLQIQRYYDYADAIVACAEGVKFDLIYNSHVHGDIRTIYNFIDQENIKTKAQKNIPNEIKDFLNGAEYFVNVGRLHTEKNQKKLILQFSYFHDINSAVKMLILGSGKLEEELISYITELGLEQSVKIIPYTTNPFAYMARAKALILSSRYEGLPNVILEAMTLECPVIAVDCLSGPRELLMEEVDYARTLEPVEIGKRGILVCNDRTEDDGRTRYLAEAMELMCTLEKMTGTFRKNEREYMEQYSNRKILEQWFAVVNEEERKEETDLLGKEENVLETANHIVIYGAGYVGKSVYLRLSRKYKIDGFVVTNRKENERECLGAKIQEIGELKYDKENTAVVIGVGYESQNAVVDKLQEYGYEKIVFPYIEPLSHTYYTNCQNLDIKSEVQDFYRLRMGEDIDLDHPKTFNQKLQWLKLYDNLPLKTTLADKYSVRRYVAEKIGEEYLVPLLGVWDSFDQIDFSQLPDRFVLKCTHGSNMNIVVRDKSKLDYAMAKRKFDKWMQINYAYTRFEMNYEKIKPRILAEEMLEADEETGDIPDYKLMCFHGKVKCSFICSERFSKDGLKVTFYDSDWSVMPFERHYPRSQYPISKPKNYDKMVELAEKLADDLIFVRVDFYEVQGKIYFGELTFYPGSGVEEFSPAEWDGILGEWIHIPPDDN